MRTSLTEKSNNNDKMTTSATSQKKIDLRMSLTEKSNNNDKMTTTMFMPDDLCGVIKDYLKPVGKGFIVEVLIGYAQKVGILPPEYIKYFIEADERKAFKYFEEQIQKMIKEGTKADVVLKHQEYIDGKWVINKYDEQYESIDACCNCSKIGRVKQEDNVNELFMCACDMCNECFCWDCEGDGINDDDPYCKACYDEIDLTDEEED